MQRYVGRAKVSEQRARVTFAPATSARPQGSADLPAAGRLRPALQVAAHAMREAPKMVRAFTLATNWATRCVRSVLADGLASRTPAWSSSVPRTCAWAP